MENQQLLTGETKPNRNNYGDKDLVFLKGLVEGCFGFKHQEEYEFEGEARKVHDDKAKAIDSFLNLQDFEPKKSLVPVLICQDGRSFIKTNNSYKKQEVIMKCYGVLKVYDESQVTHQMFVTNFGMVLDGREKGNLWRYVKESCVPNCEIKQGFVKGIDEGSVPSFLCSLVATKEIQAGETLRVDYFHLRGLPSRDKDCTCKEKYCVGEITAPHRCSYKDCEKWGHGFSSAHALQNHLQVKHALNQNATTTTKETHKCSKCETSFKNKGSLQRHQREKHPSKPADRNICKMCGKSFARKQTLEEHRKKACKGEKLASN